MVKENSKTITRTTEKIRIRVNKTISRTTTTKRTRRTRKNSNKSKIKKVRKRKGRIRAVSTAADKKNYKTICMRLLHLSDIASVKDELKI